MNQLDFVFEEFQKLPTKPMNQQQSELFMALVIGGQGLVHGEGDSATTIKIYNDFKERFWPFEALTKRVEACLTVNIDKSVLCMIFLICNGNVGAQILFAYYIQYYAKTVKDEKEFTFDDFVDLYPMGYPSLEGISKCWDMQKSPQHGNMIDDEKQMEHLQFDKASV